MSRRLRFSLTTLLLLTTLLGMAITIALLWREASPLQQEVREYREELGILTIQDHKMVHAIRVPSKEDEPRKYRVYLPPGHVYWFHYGQVEIPRSGIVASNSVHRLEPGEYLVSVQFQPERDPESDETLPYASFHVRIEPQQAQQGITTLSVEVGEQTTDWIRNELTGEASFTWNEIGKEVQMAAPHLPLILYRARAREVVVDSTHPDGSPSSWATKAIKGPTDGFLAWISTEQHVKGSE